MVPEPAIEASSLLANAAGLDKIYIHSRPEMQIDENSVLKFEEFIERRISGEPNSYITEKREFYSKEFFVNKDVLIPRPETELIVDEALKVIPHSGTFVVADICAGSGCIGITLRSIKDFITLISADLSFPSVLVASRNAKLNQSEDGSFFLNTNFLDCIKEKSVDLVVCNPPYISEGEFKSLQTEVRDFEPRQALVSCEDGLAHIKEIIKRSRSKLKNGGWIILEIGIGQSRQVERIFRLSGYNKIKTIFDINNYERVIKAQWNEY